MRKILYILGAILSFMHIRLFESAVDYIRTGYKTRKMQAIGKQSVLKKGVLVIGAENIIIGKNTEIGRRVTLSTWSSDYHPELIIGNDVSIGSDCHITAANKILISDGVLIGKMVTITDNSHGAVIPSEMNTIPKRRRILSKGEVIIGKNVWIGDKSTLLPGVKIGDCSIIGANSVVTGNVPSYSVCVGNPAKIVKIIR